MQPIGLPAWFKLVISLVVFSTFGIFFSNAFAMSSEPATHVPGGVTFAGDYTPDDVAYFDQNLELLHAQLPSWWQYVIDSRPFVLTVDRAPAKSGIVAQTQCCDMAGRGTIRFGYHFGNVPVGTDVVGQSQDAERITFLGVLAHELTHVRDLRAKRFAPKTDRKSCVAAELSGLAQQLAIKQDFASAKITNDSSSVRWLKEEIESEAHDLRSRPFWDWYCAAFE